MSPTSTPRPFITEQLPVTSPGPHPNQPTSPTDTIAITMGTVAHIMGGRQGNLAE